MYDELRHLVLIVEHGTFTEAARHAHLSQPALTASIRRLEAHVGAKVLHRGRDGARLTAAGEALLPRAQASLAALEDGIRAVAEVEGLRAGEVRLGAGATACSYLLPPALVGFATAHPGIRYFLRENTTDESLGPPEGLNQQVSIPNPEPPAISEERLSPTIKTSALSGFPSCENTSTK